MNLEKFVNILIDLKKTTNEFPEKFQEIIDLYKEESIIIVKRTYKKKKKELEFSDEMKKLLLDKCKKLKPNSNYDLKKKLLELFSEEKIIESKEILQNWIRTERDEELVKKARELLKNFKNIK